MTKTEAIAQVAKWISNRELRAAFKSDPLGTARTVALAVSGVIDLLALRSSPSNPDALPPHWGGQAAEPEADLDVACAGLASALEVEIVEPGAVAALPFGGLSLSVVLDRLIKAFIEAVTDPQPV